MAAVARRPAQAAPPGRPRQEPAAAELRAPPRHPAAGAHLRLHRRAAPRTRCSTNLPELPKENLLGEPIGRDTANAVGFPAAVLLKRDPDAVIAVVTADHVIEPIDTFQASHPDRASTSSSSSPTPWSPSASSRPTATRASATSTAASRSLRKATAPTGAYRVQAFKEKPDKPTADRYVESGRYYWNSGMFVWRCDTVLNELATHLPERYTRPDADRRRVGHAAARRRCSTRSTPSCPRSASTTPSWSPPARARARPRSSVVEMPVQWLDVGSWPALAETLPTDEHNNAVACDTCVFVDSDDNIIVSDDPEHLVTPDRHQRHDHRAHQGRDDGLPQERGAAGEGAGREG